MLGDALRCLSSKHIKVAAARGAAADDGDEDAAAAVGAAKGRLVSQVRVRPLMLALVIC